eukprot:11461419-Karenia_brevis.AAC.1
MTWGMKIIGCLPDSNLFGTARPRASMSTSAFLSDADAWNTELAFSKQNSEDDDRIFSMCDVEREAGKLSEFLSKSQLDEMFGRGNWRAIRRRVIFQHSKNKYRLIDVANKSLTNNAANIPENISTCPHDMSAS